MCNVIESYFVNILKLFCLRSIGEAYLSFPPSVYVQYQELMHILLYALSLSLSLSLSPSLSLCWSGSQEVMHMNSDQEPVDFESSNAVEDQLNLDAPDSSM